MATIIFTAGVLISVFIIGFTEAFHSANGLFGLLFGFQKVCLCRCGVASRAAAAPWRGGRLLGGEALAPHELPWLALVLAPGAGGGAGGALITDAHVLTAASLVHGVAAGSVTVTLGAHGRCSDAGAALNSSVAALLIHPRYSPLDHHNDIALLRLAHLVPFSQFVAPICLPPPGSTDEGLVGAVAAWRERAVESWPCAPRVATLPLLPARSCLKAPLAPTLVTNDKGCLGPIGAKSIVCKVDAGSPVMVRSGVGPYHLTGILSSSAACDEQVTPLYTRVSDHLTWILTNIRNDCLCF